MLVATISNCLNSVFHLIAFLSYAPIFSYLRSFSILSRIIPHIKSIARLVSS